jgi:hypothetical protein
MAVDWSGRVAHYNNGRVPSGRQVHLVHAPGGLRDDPFGFIARPMVADTPLYGSSFATALVTAALAR